MSQHRDVVNAHARAYISSVESWIVNNLYSDFKLNKKQLDWSPKRTASRGGFYAKGPGINMAMALHKTDSSRYTRRWSEYASFDADKIIGGFYYKNDAYISLDATIVHEIAHALQFYYYDAFSLSRGKPHGDTFKRFYAKLRTQFINNRLVDQNKLHEEFTNSRTKFSRQNNQLSMTL